MKKSSKYGINNISGGLLYDESNQPIKDESGNTKANISNYIKYKTITTPSTAKYVVLATQETTTEVYFGKDIKNVNLKSSGDIYANIILPPKDNKITELNENIATQSKNNKFDNIFNLDIKYVNLIDESKLTQGTLRDDGYTKNSNSGSYQVVEYTELNKNKIYTLKSNLPIISLFFYNENYEFIIKKVVNTTYDGQVTFTLNDEYLGEELDCETIYMRANLSYADTQSKFGGSMLVEGSEIDKYVPYNDVSKTTLNNIDTVLNQILGMKKFFKLLGKKWVAHGDSITYYSSNYEQYVKYANNYLYCDLTNLGHAGATMALRNSENVSSVTDGTDKLSMAYLSSVTDYSKYDICTIFFGTNDMSSNVPVGTIDSEDETTYLGALNKSIQRMYVSNYKLKILLITPIYRIEETNLGLNAYRTALNDFGKKHGIPVVNMHELCNINAFNKSGTLKDGLHPTGTGAEHIGAVLAGEMLRYF